MNRTSGMEATMGKSNWRIERFHLTSKRDAVVMPHPQAKTKSAMEQGYIVLRFEAWVSDDFKNIVVAQLNAAQIEAPVVSSGSAALASEVR